MLVVTNGGDSRVGDLAQRQKALATEPDDLSSVSMGKERTKSQSPLTPTHTPCHVCTCTHINRCDTLEDISYLLCVVFVFSWSLWDWDVLERYLLSQFKRKEVSDSLKTFISGTVQNTKTKTLISALAVLLVLVVLFCWFIWLCCFCCTVSLVCVTFGQVS